MSLLALLASGFLFVFLLGIQQLNVTAGRSWLAFVTAMAICGAQLVQFKVLPGPTTTLDLVALMLGSALGVVASMKAHPWLLRALDPGALWPLRLQNWLGAEVRAFAAEEARKQRELESDIAYQAARSDIEQKCKSLWIDGTWYDTQSVIFPLDEESPAEDLCRLQAVRRAVDYLEGRDALIHHAHVHSLVRFKP